MDQEKISLETLKSAVKDKGAKWTPEETTLTLLSTEEKAQRLGLLPTEMETSLATELGLNKPLTSKSSSKRTRKTSNPGSVGLPSKIDWRNVSGVNWTTYTKDQGSCGSCVAFGTIAALETLLRRRCYNDPNKNIDLSEAHLLFCGGGSCNGWHMTHACNYLKANGVPDEACFPYSHGLSTKSCTTCSDWKNRIGHTKIPSWTNTKDVEQMKKNLVENGPQITGMAVYQDFFSYSGGIYEHVSGGLAGYHCVAVVGYDDQDECWICKNSWGTGWGEPYSGERGWFRIKYGQCGMEDVFGMWNMTVTKPAGCGWASHLLVDYSFTSRSRTIWAYAGNKWRYRRITESQVNTIAKLLMEASKIWVCWKDGEMTFARAVK